MLQFVLLNTRTENTNWHILYSFDNTEYRAIEFTLHHESIATWGSVPIVDFSDPDIAWGIESTYLIKAVLSHDHIGFDSRCGAGVAKNGHSK